MLFTDNKRTPYNNCLRICTESKDIFNERSFDETLLCRNNVVILFLSFKPIGN